jgi:hypothetical protein
LFKAALAAVLLSTSFAVPAAGPLDEVSAAYERGDYETMLSLVFPLAVDGMANAQFMLGDMHIKGFGVRQDWAEAAKWYLQAADQGHPVAQFMLGVLYSSGLGVLQDNVQAHRWFSVSLAYLSPSDTERRASAAKNRDSVAKKMSQAQIAEARSLANEWKRK